MTLIQWPSSLTVDDEEAEQCAHGLPHEPVTTETALPGRALSAHSRRRVELPTASATHGVARGAEAPTLPSSAGHVEAASRHGKEVQPSHQSAETMLQGSEPLLVENPGALPSEARAHVMCRAAEQGPAPSLHSEGACAHGDTSGLQAQALGEQDQRHAGARPRIPRLYLSRQHDEKQLPDFMVCLPAGSGHSEPLAALPFSAITEGTPVPRPSCQRCSELEATLRSARLEHAEALRREQLGWREEHSRLRGEEAALLDEAARRAASAERELAAERRQQKQQEQRWVTGQEERELAAEEAAGPLWEEERREASLVSELRRELVAEAALAGGAARWQQLALEASAQLAEAEGQREACQGRAAQARRRAAEAERQRRELEKRGAPRELARLREELQALAGERDALGRRAERLAPCLQAARSEEAELRRLLVDEAQAATEEARAAQQESAEVARLREYAGRARRGLQSQLEAAGAEARDAQGQRRAAQLELSREQRQRLDELRRHRAMAADREKVKTELEQLRHRLMWAETALQTRMEEPASTAGRSQRSSASHDRQLGSSTESKSRGHLHVAACIADQGLMLSPGSEGLALLDEHESMVEPEPAREAGTRLFEMIERAKQRADQRRLLSGTAEEVRVKAHALEELLAREVITTGVA